MHERLYPHPAHPHHGWAEPPHRRRRLNRKGWTVVLVLFALLCALLLGALKLGRVLWNAPITAKAANAAVRVGTVAADVTMKHYEVPKEVRTAVTEEAHGLRQEVFGNAADAEERPEPSAATPD